jgi:hypothetical protein
LTFPQARWLWAISGVLMIVWMLILMVRNTEPDSKPETFFVALFLLSMNGAGVAIGNGQLTLHILAPLFAGVLLWERVDHTWKTDLITSVLLLLGSIKPSLFLPFFILILFRAFRLRPFLLFLSGYAFLTAVAMLFQDQSLVAVLQNWIFRGIEVAGGGGYGNVHSWLSAAGWEQWSVIASILLLILFSVWVYLNRGLDFRIQLAVAALVARCWTYHRMYDDVLIIFPMIALFRVSKEPGSRWTPSLLLVLMAVLNLARLSNISTLRYLVLITAHQILWGAVLLFLLSRRNIAAEARSAV